MKNLKYIRISSMAVLLFNLLLIMSCQQKAQQKDDDDDKQKSSDIITLSTQQVQVAGIQFGSIGQRPIASVVKCNGQLVLPPSSQAMVTALVSGNVTKVFIKEGSVVSRGQVIGYFESPEAITTQEEYLTTKQNLQFLTQEYQRQKLLNDENAGTGKVYQQAKANYLAEVDKENSLAASLSQMRINVSQLNSGQVIREVPIIAPMSGKVNHVNMYIGSPVEINKPLADIYSDEGIYADLKIFEKDISKVKVGQTVELGLEGNEQSDLNGRIYALNSAFESDNRVVIAHVSLLKHSGGLLIPGTYLSASIATDSSKSAAVPEAAVVNDGGQSYIYLLLDGKKSEKEDTKKDDKDDDDNDTKGKSDDGQGVKFKKVEVVTGASDQGFIAIQPVVKLPDNARIAIAGAKYILAESQKGDGGDDD